MTITIDQNGKIVLTRDDVLRVTDNDDTFIIKDVEAIKFANAWIETGIITGPAIVEVEKLIEVQ